MAKRAGVKLDAVRKVAASATVAPELGAYYCAPAGPVGKRRGWALYDARGFYVGVTLPGRPVGLLAHTKATATLKRRMAEDAPKRRPS